MTPATDTAPTLPIELSTPPAVTRTQPQPIAADPAEDPDTPLLGRIYNILGITLPLVGLIAAIVHLWGWGIGITELSLMLSMYVLTGLGVTIGYHRLFTHKSFETGPVLTTVFAILGSMAAEGPLLRWVAFHRTHHQHSDKDGDPHSPHTHGAGLFNMIKGAWNAHVGWIFNPRDPDYARYTKDLEKQPLIRTLSKLFPLWLLLSLVIPALIGGLVSMSWTGAVLGLLWGGLVRIFVVHHITWSVNSICHIWGTKPYNSHDESRNNPIVGVLAFGEGWHNNHHAFPTSARHGLAWWQFDLSYVVIWTLTKLGLARNVRIPAPERLAAKQR